MFERFTERARQVVVLAQEEARALGHNHIGTEHLLLGLLREQEGLAARLLESLDVPIEEARARVVRIVPAADDKPTGQIPFTPRAKKALELSLREALSFGHEWIGTEHILLGLVRDEEGVAVAVLLDFGADAKTIRNGVISMLSGVTPRAYAGSSPEVETRLRRVVPVAEQFRDGTWLVSVEVWDHGLVIRWARSQRWPPAHLYHRSWHGWRVSDDSGTNYSQVGGNGGDNPVSGYRGEATFEPAPPSTATSLWIQHEIVDGVLSVSLAD